MSTTAVRKKCPHNREKYWCRACGGAGICEHGRRRRLCKSCCGSFEGQGQRGMPEESGGRTKGVGLMTSFSSNAANAWRREHSTESAFPSLSPPQKQFYKARAGGSKAIRLGARPEERICHSCKTLHHWRTKCPFSPSGFDFETALDVETRQAANLSLPSDNDPSTGGAACHSACNNGTASPYSIEWSSEHVVVSACSRTRFRLSSSDRCSTLTYKHDLSEHEEDQIDSTDSSDTPIFEFSSAAERSTFLRFLEYDGEDEWDIQEGTGSAFIEKERAAKEVSGPSRCYQVQSSRPPQKQICKTIAGGGKVIGLRAGRGERLCRNCLSIHHWRTKCSILPSRNIKERRCLSETRRMMAGMTEDELRPMFCMRQEDAARALGVSASALTKCIRRFGIRRWPYRSLKASLQYQKCKAVQDCPVSYEGRRMTAYTSWSKRSVGFGRRLCSSCGQVHHYRSKCATAMQGSRQEEEKQEVQQHKFTAAPNTGDLQDHVHVPEECLNHLHKNVHNAADVWRGATKRKAPSLPVCSGIGESAAAGNVWAELGWKRVVQPKTPVSVNQVQAGETRDTSSVNARDATSFSDEANRIPSSCHKSELGLGFGRRLCSSCGQVHHYRSKCAPGSRQEAKKQEVQQHKFTAVPNAGLGFGRRSCSSNNAHMLFTNQVYVEEAAGHDWDVSGLDEVVRPETPVLDEDVRPGTNVLNDYEFVIESVINNAPGVPCETQTLGISEPDDGAAASGEAVGTTCDSNQPLTDQTEKDSRQAVELHLAGETRETCGVNSHDASSFMDEVLSSAGATYSSWLASSECLSVQPFAVGGANMAAANEQSAAGTPVIVRMLLPPTEAHSKTETCHNLDSNEKGPDIDEDRLEEEFPTIDDEWKGLSTGILETAQGGIIAERNEAEDGACETLLSL